MEPFKTSVGKSEIPIRDCRELDAYRQQEFLKVMVQSLRVEMAPILALTRIAAMNSASGLSTRIEIDQVTKIADKILRVEIAVDTFHIAGGDKQRHILYLFRALSGSPIEPFLCITQEASYQVVTAFESDKEFVMCNIEGDESTILKELKIAVKEKGMRALLRYIDLWKQNTLEGGVHNERI